VIYEKLAKDNPSSADAQRDVGISLIKLGDVLVVSRKAGGGAASVRVSW